jgi:hypothetical protein
VKIIMFWEVMVAGEGKMVESVPAAQFEQNVAQ